MLHRGSRDLRVVNESEDPTDKVIEQIMSELNREDHPADDIEEQVRRHRKRFRRRVILITASVLTLVTAVYLLIYLQTYQKVRVLDTYKSKGAASNSYTQFAGGVLKYSRDGIAYLNKKGEEQWNQSYQIKSPYIDVNDKAAAVADKGGNDICVFGEDGLKGEIHTTLPIEKISVSKQGIVSAILKNESAPRVMCYDSAGNVLVEHKASLAGAGYPIDVTLSEDGEVMLVSYLHTQDGRITSRVIYYNFGEAGEEQTDRQVAEAEYRDTIMPDTFFIDKDTSVIVGDNRLVIYKGVDKPVEKSSIMIDKEIKSVFHNEKYIGLALQNKGKEGYELRLYNAGGRQVLSKDFSGDYSNAKICGSQVIMYDGKKCSIIMKTGVHKFSGEFEKNIMEIFPVAGVNKYIVMNADGMEVVRLVK